MSTPKPGDVRAFILSNVERYPNDIARVAAEHFGLSRQAVNSHLKALVDAGALIARGRTRGRTYKPKTYGEASLSIAVSAELAEDTVWRDNLAKYFDALPKNVRDICHHGFTEIFNNVIDHSAASSVAVKATVSSVSTTMTVYDDGVGIFQKIADALKLDDPGQAILELVKGKVTTDPERHTGEGIFFTSRMFDTFSILSGHHYFIHKTNDDDWFMEDRTKATPGTFVTMAVAPWTQRTVQQVFDRFATEDDDYAFTQTRVPVKLLTLRDEPLVSRSQAKRLVTRFERFRVVILDFDEVETIGQAFADEVFRVFQSQHPSIRIEAVNTTESVDRAIRRARSNNV